ncbi:site-2 protease family protein [Candidatus Berkelbacteria bacterium CG_4_9_14_3_um_filter_39_23]|uniref:Site-2 protease family protein n=2 Tax=Candidatus Berkelbacteria TaxID=1618330 RepID=A0A2M7CHJ3_9BACT|nr:site-2 protease family protein [Candidatus Berkelbacteria bacterium]OIP05062.1 MAG: hypothetical protein AUK14_02125 [Candidatus Berkelbacteria bacterium CG2_30_39_44]PIR28186.1 MAG: site-2 protease family protein [Candidatus Berkelbacteria bacterium CG11_big_fil_rev_8_21_14_0_20_40_23]PIV25126.1 MAG: site-2 protease family protein [Candidatus Berkelbacteria bacterium CG03_land_8_20_14_0_80_40_36]PIX30875.1 MAG: site-2 protease family protein [Candidatus Berkelbacteria bacterium CG_4_8_14_3_
MLISNLLTDPWAFFSFAIALLVAFSFHEASHAFVALKLGDNTAQGDGRVNLNPLVHLDPLGTIFLLTLGFGWGKPVRINPNNFNNPRVGSLLSALAGPGANFFLAIIFGLALRFFSPYFSANLSSLLSLIVFINLILMIFNLIPIPPLDGSNILELLVPTQSYIAFAKNGTYFLFALILLSFLGIPVFETIVYAPASWIYHQIIGAEVLGIL